MSMNGTDTKVAVFECTVIRNDEECIRILTDANLLDKVKRHYPFTTTNMIFTHDGNVCLLIYNEGHQNPEDNGYEIVQVQEGSTPRSVIIQFLASVIEADRLPGTPCEGMTPFLYAGVEDN